jgi:2',3'-cyclic-nucleotide 2'-phosphodiesterase
LGITEKTANALFDIGVDVITTGNHVYRHREAYEFLDRTESVIRPANYMTGNPGRGHTIVCRAGRRVAVVNLSGTVELRAARSPFSEADTIVERLGSHADAIVVDFHAEATSEKVAMGWHLDGRVAAVLGTHTHVPTADARVLPGGTAFISDVGMTGPYDSILGRRVDRVLFTTVTFVPSAFDVAEGDPRLAGALVDVDPATGRAQSIRRFMLDEAGLAALQPPTGGTP